MGNQNHHRQLIISFFVSQKFIDNKYEENIECLFVVRSGGGLGVRDNETECQKWLPPPNVVEDTPWP